MHDISRYDGIGKNDAERCPTKKADHLVEVVLVLLGNYGNRSSAQEMGVQGRSLYKKELSGARGRRK